MSGEDRSGLENGEIRAVETVLALGHAETNPAAGGVYRADHCVDECLGNRAAGARQRRNGREHRGLCGCERRRERCGVQWFGFRSSEVPVITVADGRLCLTVDRRNREAAHSTVRENLMCFGNGIRAAEVGECVDDRERV